MRLYAALLMAAGSAAALFSVVTSLYPDWVPFEVSGEVLFSLGVGGAIAVFSSIVIAVQALKIIDLDATVNGLDCQAENDHKRFNYLIGHFGQAEVASVLHREAVKLYDDAHRIGDHVQYLLHGKQDSCPDPEFRGRIERWWRLFYRLNNQVLKPEGMEITRPLNIATAAKADWPKCVVA